MFELNACGDFFSFAIKPINCGDNLFLTLPIFFLNIISNAVFGYPISLTMAEMINIKNNLDIRMQHIQAAMSICDDSCDKIIINDGPFMIEI